MLEYFGGVPKAIVPDNLKSGVTKPCYYEPDINRSYQELAEYYGLAVLPARVRKPQDKAKVETSVQIVERRILAKLRGKKFSSLAELNQSIKELLKELNSREMKSYGCSRQKLFEEMEKPTLSPLPRESFKVSKWKLAKVNIDYHVELDRRYYSVPYELRGEQVEVQACENSISIYHNNKQIAVHPRILKLGHHSTSKEHMPKEHRFMQEWTPSRFLDWAAKIGPETKQQIDFMLNSRKYPEQSYRACLGILRLAKKYGEDRLELASKRANQLGIVSFKSINSMLKTGQEKISIHSPAPAHIDSHQNIRGSRYYH